MWDLFELYTYICASRSYVILLYIYTNKAFQIAVVRAIPVAKSTARVIVETKRTLSTNTASTAAFKDCVLRAPCSVNYVRRYVRQFVVCHEVMKHV